MEWDMKSTPWDLGELDQNAEPDIGSVVASSVGLERQTRRLDCSVDLKLGGLGDFGSPEKWKEQPRASAMVSASSGSSKRARTPGNGGGHNTVCLVEGCKADLSICREYHRRHKVCEVHSKTPVVIVNGHQQRFCQQCSRFHLLGEFDDIKRSCRKRLEGHNRRRRKPQPDSINSVILFPNQQGTKFSPYPQVYSSATIEPNWSRIIKSEDEASLYNHHPAMHLVEQQHQFPCSFSRSFREAKQFPFLQESNDGISSRMSSLESSVHKTVSLVENSNYGLTQVLDSDCALSLLSSSTQTPSINLGHMMPADRIPMAQPLGSPLQYLGLGPYSHSQASNNVSTTGFSCSGIDDGRVTAVLVRDGGDTGIHCQPMFHVSGEGSSDGASQSLPFSWD